MKMLLEATRSVTHISTYACSLTLTGYGVRLASYGRSLVLQDREMLSQRRERGSCSPDGSHSLSSQKHSPVQLLIHRVMITTLLCLDDSNKHRTVRQHEVLSYLIRDYSTLYYQQRQIERTDDVIRKRHMVDPWRNTSLYYICLSLLQRSYSIAMHNLLLISAFVSYRSPSHFDVSKVLVILYVIVFHLVNAFSQFSNEC